MMRQFGNAVILVCGGAGFIGSNFIRSLLASYPKTSVVCVDKLTYAGSKENLKGLPSSRLTFVKGDIADRALMQKVFAKYQPTHVINFAAETHVDRSIHLGAEVFVHTNVLGTTVLVDEARKLPKLQKFVQVSTDEVYGSLPLQSKKKFTETTPLSPNSPYAASKAAADLIALSFFTTYKLPVIVTRCSNNYGPYQHPEKFIPHSVLRVLQGKPIAIYGDGKNSRDWIYVEDHCNALLGVLRDGMPGEVYNIGASEEMNNRALAAAMLRHLEKNSSYVTFTVDRPGHDRRYAIDASKIRKKLGWRPAHSVKTSLQETIMWYVTHTHWVGEVLKRGAVNTHIV